MRASTREQSDAEESAPPIEVEQLKRDLGREHEMYVRALADFDRYRRRVERERASAVRAGKREILLPLLDVIDSFDLLLKHLGEAPKPVVDGARAIHRQLLALIEAQGVKPFESVGRPFAPELHEAIGTGASDEYGPGVVGDELRRGYRWGDTVLRPARVRVAS